MRFNTAYYESKLIFSTSTIALAIHRYGFEPKFVLSILSSRYCFHNFFLNNEKENDETRTLTISEIKSLEIPVIPLEQQQPFVTIVNYILNCNANQDALLFFERLLDAMVYELYFPNLFKVSGIEILSFLKDLPKIESDMYDFSIDNIYKNLSRPENDLNLSLLKILNLTEINNIENSL